MFPNHPLDFILNFCTLLLCRSKVEEKWTHGRGTADPVIFLEPYVETYAGTQLIPETQVDET